METLLWVLHVIVAVSLVGVILMQPGQSGGMGTAFGGGGSQTVFGSQGSSGFLGKLTAVLGALFFLTSLGLAMLAKTGEESLLEGGEQPAQEQQQEVPVAPGERPGGPPIPGTGGQQR